MRSFFLLPVFAILFAGQQNVQARLSVSPFGPSIDKIYETSVPASTHLNHVSSQSFMFENESKVASAINHLQALDLPNFNYVVKNSYVTQHNQVTHVYLRQVINGLEVINGDININVDKDGHVISYGNSFYTGAVERSENSFINNDLSIDEAFNIFAKHINQPVDAFHGITIVEDSANSFSPKRTAKILGASFSTNPIDVEKVYIQAEGGILEHGWRIVCEMEENWFDTFVSSSARKVTQMIDWVSDAMPFAPPESAAYRVVPFGKADPRESEPVLVLNPADFSASPLGWHDMGNGGGKRTDTAGNNVFAQDNRVNRPNSENNPKPDGGPEHIFDFKPDFTKHPRTYADAATVNLFYLNNMIHDVFYQYGFDEVSGNFQQSNFDKGGLGRDAVIANAQDGSGTNNANFATPPDGRPGKMRMYIWTISNPPRDGDYDSLIVIHEYGHGISTRLTGGPANSGCLQFGESGGMGEGIKFKLNYLINI